ncbi:MFS transporter [Streptomyces sp. NPDC001939]
MPTAALAAKAAYTPVPLPTSTQARRPCPAVIWALLIGTFVVRSAGFAYPFLSLHLAHALYSPSTVGRVLAQFGIGWLVGHVLTGWSADRLGRRTTLVAAVLLAAVTLPLLASAHSVLAVSAGAFVAGAVYDASRPIVSAVVTDVIQDEPRRVQVRGWRHFAVYAGAAFSGSIGGVLADDSGTVTPFGVNAAVCLAFAALAAPFLGNTRRAGTSGARGDCRAEVADRWLWLAGAFGMVCAAGMVTVPPTLMAEDGLSTTAYGWTQPASAVSVLVLR